MKYNLIALAATLVLSACAGTNVKNTHVASGALAPSAIYIRPFPVNELRGSNHGKAQQALTQAQTPHVFAQMLKQELEKIAPTVVLADHEVAPEGWLVEGEIELLDAGCPWARGIAGHLGIGRSGALTHVRVLDVNGHASRDGKGDSGNVLYDFDVAGGSRLTGRGGSLMAPGLGNAVPFDLRNTAERVGQALNPDTPLYGSRVSASLR